MAGDQSFKGVLNDTDPKAKGRSFAIDITGTGYNHFLGKRIGDTVDGMFVGEGDQDTHWKSQEVPIPLGGQCVQT
jgi:ribosomal protein S6E (S10)